MLALCCSGSTGTQYWQYYNLSDISHVVDGPQRTKEPSTLSRWEVWITKEPIPSGWYRVHVYLERFWQLCCHSSVDTWSYQDGPCGDRVQVGCLNLNEGKACLSGLFLVSLLPESTVGFLFLNSSLVRWDPGQPFPRSGPSLYPPCNLSCAISFYRTLCGGWTTVHSIQYFRPIKATTNSLILKLFKVARRRKSRRWSEQIPVY